MVASDSRILIVDSNAVVRRAVKRAVDSDPALVVCGESDAGPQLEAMLNGLQPALLLLDLSLHDGDGLNLVTHLRRRHRDLRILIFSAHSESLFAHRALRAGADGYLRKGCAEEELLNAMHTVLGGAVYVSDSLQKNILQRIRGQSDDAGYEEGISRLSNREAEVFELLMKGMRKRDMAHQLGISAKTVESHCAHIRRKLSAQTMPH